MMLKTINQHSLEMVKAELMQLDSESILVEGKQLKPSNCYYFGSNPIHILYNTNCPDSLKAHIEQIVEKYSEEDATQRSTG